MTTEYLGGSADAGRAAPDAMPAARTTPKRAPTSRLSSGLRATDVEDGATAGCARTTSRLARISRRFQCRHYGIGAASAALWSSSPHPGVSAQSRQKGVLGGVSLVPGAPCEQNPHKGGRKFSARAKSVEWRQAAGREPLLGRGGRCAASIRPSISSGAPIRPDEWKLRDTAIHASPSVGSAPPERPDDGLVNAKEHEKYRVRVAMASAVTDLRST
jgi:hypothetical protein